MRFLKSVKPGEARGYRIHPQPVTPLLTITITTKIGGITIHHKFYSVHESSDDVITVTQLCFQLLFLVTFK